MSDPSPASDSLVSEFMALNRRRLFGAPPLDVADLERWQCLRRTLNARYGDRLESLVSVVERRAHFRFPTHLQVHFETREGLRSAYLEDISEGGIFIATEEPLGLGTPLRLTLGAPDGSMVLSGEVTWSRPVPREQGPPGMGVRFDELNAEQRAFVDSVIADAAPEARRA